MFSLNKYPFSGSIHGGLIISASRAALSPNVCINEARPKQYKDSAVGFMPALSLSPSL